MGDVVRIGLWLGVPSGGLTFLGCWIYCVHAYGFLVGVGLGWIPSAICGFIAGVLITFLWPLIVLAALVGYYFWNRERASERAESVSVIEASSPPYATGYSDRPECAVVLEHPSGSTLIPGPNHDGRGGPDEGDYLRNGPEHTYVYRSGCWVRSGLGE